MAQQLKVDVCVIGAGSGGLSVAAGAAQMGASTVLVEKGKMGGDCLNYGCVPSKSLLAAGHAAHSAESAARLGVNCPGVEIDFSAVHDHVHGVIASIANQIAPIRTVAAKPILAVVDMMRVPRLGSNALVCARSIRATHHERRSG